MDLSLNSLFLEARYGTSKVASILQQYVDKGYFIQFSNIEKLGINPRSEFNTPLGIYAYPLTKRIYIQFRQDNIPFASDRKYIILFKPENLNIVFINPGGDSEWGFEESEDFYSNPQLEATLKTKLLDDKNIKNMFKKMKEDPNFSSLNYEYYSWRQDFLRWRRDITKDAPDDVEFFKQFCTENFELVLKQFIRDGSVGSRYKTEFGKLWNTTRLLGNGLVGWRKVLVEGGIDGVVDFGRGLIHPSEPTQAVFFSMKGLNLVEIFDNPISAHKVNTKDKSEINKLNFDLISKLNNNPLSLNPQELRKIHQLVSVKDQVDRWGEPYPGYLEAQESKKIITPETSKKLNKAFMYVTDQINQYRKRSEEFIKEILRNLGDHGVHLDHFLNSEKMRMGGDLTLDYQCELIRDYLIQKQLYGKATEISHMMYEFSDKYPEDNLILTREKQVYLKRIIDANNSAARTPNVKPKTPTKPVKQTYPNQKMMDFLSPHY